MNKITKSTLLFHLLAQCEVEDEIKCRKYVFRCFAEENNIRVPLYSFNYKAYEVLNLTHSRFNSDIDERGLVSQLTM